MNRYYNVIRPFINLIIFGFALSFEGASPERTTILVLLFAGLVAWGLIRPRFKNGQAFWYAADAVLILLLEYQSKYLVNYFFHILYISAIVEAGISLDRKRGTFAAVILSAAALSKYFYAMGFDVNASTLSQLLFNLFALAFLITLINFGKLQQEERDKSQRLYTELMEAYHRLEELSIQKEKAAVLEERNRIARDMYDSLGHRLTSLIMQIEMAKGYIKDEPGRTDEYLDRMANAARGALTDTRQALKTLSGKDGSSVSGIIGMIEDFGNSTGIAINYKLPGLGLKPEESIVLYRVIQEAITNAARHGKATRIDIQAGRDDDGVWFCIQDNGTGGEYTEGFGIAGMRRRLEEMGGSLDIQSGQGFRLEGRFKMEGDK